MCVEPGEIGLCVEPGEIGLCVEPGEIGLCAFTETVISNHECFPDKFRGNSYNSLNSKQNKSILKKLNLCTVGPIKLWNTKTTVMI